MPEIITVRCDCGCGTEVKLLQTKGWFVLSQTEADHTDKIQLFANKKLYFVDLEHNLKWLNEMIFESRKLNESLYKAPFPRGTFVSKDRILCI